MFGWDRLAAAWASRRNRSTKVRSTESSGKSTLSANRPVQLEVHGAVHLGHAATSDQMGCLVAARIDPGIVDRLHGAQSLRWAPSATAYVRAVHGAAAAVVVVTGAVVVVVGA